MEFCGPCVALASEENSAADGLYLSIYYHETSIRAWGRHVNLPNLWQISIARAASVPPSFMSQTFLRSTPSRSRLIVVGYYPTVHKSTISNVWQIKSILRQEFWMGSTGHLLEFVKVMSNLRYLRLDFNRRCGALAHLSWGMRGERVSSLYSVNLLIGGHNDFYWCGSCDHKKRRF
jgi:hypothetical protein